MMLDFLRRVLTRDLTALRKELQAYAQEAMLWTCAPGIPNSAGTLGLHLTGNLQHFIGAQLGATGYQRDRDAEFGDRDVPLRELEARIDRTIEAVNETLKDIPEEQLAKPYPLEFNGLRLPTGLFLLHLTTHLAYHLGQLDYHRRAVTRVSTGVGAQSIAELAEASA
jgi:hypothetical protein